MIKLFELRNEIGLSQRDIAKKFNISQGTYNNWENGKTQPSIEQLIEIANFFDVSLDYLVGRSEDYNGQVVKNNNVFINLNRSFEQLSPNIQKCILELINTLKQ